MGRKILRAGALVVVLVGGLVAALAVRGVLHDPVTVIPRGLEGRTVDVGGLAVRVHQSGAGQDVLLVHGSSGSIEDWGEVRAALGDRFRVTAFDRPGHGYSGDSGQHSFEHNADVALALVRILGLRDVIVVGHSYGGTTALAMALRRPAAVAAYVVVDSATYEPSRRPTLAMRVVALPLIGTGIAATFGRSQAARMIRQGLDLQFAGRRAPEEFAEFRTSLWSEPKITRSLALETLDFRANLAALSPRYPGISAPVFIVSQADDPFRRRAAERLHGDVRGSSLRLVSGTGHYVQVEKPAEVVRAIEDAARAR